MNPFKKAAGTQLVPVDDVIANLPFIVRRDHRMVAAFAKQSHATDYAQSRSFYDESRFTIHTATEVIDVYQDGDSEKERTEAAS